MTRGAFKRAISVPFKVRCLSTLPFLRPWQDTHTYTVSCPQNTWLRFLSPNPYHICKISHPFKWEDYRSRRKLSTNNSCDQTQRARAICGKCKTYQRWQVLLLLASYLYSRSHSTNASYFSTLVGFLFKGRGEVQSMTARAKSVILKITELSVA